PRSGVLGCVRGEPAASLRLAEAAPAGSEDDGVGVDHVLAAGGPPAVLGPFERAQRRLGEGGAGAGLEGVLERHRDREAGAVAHLEQSLASCAAALGEAVAALLVSELAPELLEPAEPRA